MVPAEISASPSVIRDALHGDAPHGDALHGDTLHGDALHGDALHSYDLNGDAPHSDLYQSSAVRLPKFILTTTAKAHFDLD